MEAKSCALLRVQALAMAPRLFEKDKGAVDIGVNEVVCRIDRAVDVGFGGEVDHRVGTHLVKQRPNCVAVGNVAAHEAIARVAAMLASEARLAA